MKKIIILAFASVLFCLVSCASFWNYVPSVGGLTNTKSLSLVGTGWVSLDYDATTDIDGARGLSLWFKTGTLEATGYYLLSNYGGGSTAVGLLFYGATNKIQVYATASQEAIATSTTSQNAWHHLYINFDGTKTAAGLKIYVDGSDLGHGSSFTWSGADTTGTGWLIGRLQTVNFGHWSGKIDEVVWYNTSDTSRAATLYNSGTPTTPPSSGRVKWMRFEDDLTDEDGGASGSAVGTIAYSTDVP